MAVTPTASGKTLCYNLPVLSALLVDPGARALYLFPTKALAQDQLTELQNLSEALPNPVAAYTYDGEPGLLVADIDLDEADGGLARRLKSP